MDSETYFLWGIAVGIGLCIVSFLIICCLMDRLEEWWCRYRRRRGAVIQEAIEKYKGASTGCGKRGKESTGGIEKMRVDSKRWGKRNCGRSITVLEST